MAWDPTKPADGGLRVASEIRNNFQELDKVVRGSAVQEYTFNGPDGRTVSFSPAVANVRYNVVIEVPAEDHDVGQIWITDKTTSSFVVRNSGGSRGFFNWSLVYAVTAA